MTALSRLAAAATRMGLPFKKAPPPSVAVKSSFSCGAYTTPTTTRWFIASAIDTQKMGYLCTKFVVPVVNHISVNQKKWLHEEKYTINRINDPSGKIIQHFTLGGLIIVGGPIAVGGPITSLS